MTCLQDFFLLAHFHALHCSLGVFPLYSFPSLTDDTHILGFIHVVSLVFECFVSQLAFMGLLVQPCKCSTWVPSSLSLKFVPLVEFCWPLYGIKILGVLFGFASFASSFL